MPYARPTLTALRSQAQADLGAPALLRNSNLRVLADVLAMGVNGHYGYLDWIARQAIPFTATDEHLEAWAALKGVIRKAPTAATGSVLITGSPGITIPSGALLSSAAGQTYATTAPATIGAAGTVTVSVAGQTTGAASNADPGVVLAFSNALSGVSGATVASSLVGGADLETDAELRTRMLLAYSAPPQGGSLTDYLGWAEGVPGVTRAWIASGLMGPGSIVCWFMMDDAEAGHAGFPQGRDGVAALETRDTSAAGDQLAVANALYARCNVTALVYAVAPKPNTVNITLAGLSSASTAVRQAITSALASLFAVKGSPGGARLPDGSAGGVVLLSDVTAAINAVAGSSGATITAVTASAGAASPTTNIQSATGYLPVLGAVTFA